MRAGLTALCFWAGAALACEAPGVALPISIAGPSLLEVTSPGTDVRLRVDGHVTDTATSRYAPEFRWLSGADDPKGLIVCVEPVFNMPLGGPIRHRVHDGRAFSAVQRRALAALSDAGTLWHNGDEAARLGAISIYTSAAKDLPTRFARLSRYFAALGSAALFRLDEARDLVSELTPAASDPFLNHALAWLRAEAVMLNQRDMAQPRALAQRAVAAARKAFPRDVPMMQVLLSETYIVENDFERARAILDDALAHARDDPRSLAQIYNNLGYIEIRRSYQARDAQDKQAHLQASAEVHLKAKDFAIEARDYPAAALIFNNLGWLYERLDDLVHAQHYLRRSLDAVYGRASLRSDVLTYANLGAIYVRLGDLLKAEVFLEHAERVYQTSERSRLATLACDVGTLRRGQGRLADARAQHEACAAGVAASYAGEPDEAALKLAEAQFELGRDHLALADAAMAIEAFETAHAHLRQASPSGLDRRETGRLQPRLVASQAYAHALLGDTGAAHELLGQLPFWDEIAEPTARVDVMTHAFLAQRVTGARDSAWSVGVQLVEEIDALFAVLDLERLGPAWADRTHEAYQAVIDLAYERYLAAPQANAAGLFDLVERSRAPGMRRALHVAGEAARPGTEGPRDVHRLARLGALANDLAAQGTAAQGAADTQLQRYRTHDAWLAREPDARLRASLPPAVSLDEAMRSLAVDEAMLYYVLGAQHSFVLQVRAQGMQVHRIEAADIDGLIDRTVQQVRNRSAGRVELAGALTSLVPSGTDLQGVNKLYLVPHRAMHLLPTALLQYRGVFLEEQFSFTLIPSASVLLADKPPVPDRSLELAILADPVFSADTIARQLGRGDAMRSWSRQLQRLPWSKAEAEKLSGVFAGRAVVAFTGEAATRRNLFRRDVREARILHLASHGFFGGDDSDNVGLMLSPLEGQAEAYFVTYTELMGGNFSNELVVISGCETARGQRLRGEAPMSVARAFLTQGVGHVLATLWPVSDRASAVFMERFYRAVRDTQDYAVALSIAQAQMRRHPQYRAPYFWAGYQLNSNEKF